MRLLLPFVSSLCFASAAFGQVRFELLTTVDLSSTSNPVNPEFIGSNPAAVAWNGTDLWVGGASGAGVVIDTALVKVSNALTAPTFGTSFGRVQTPNLRGYTGLDFSNGRLAASWDPGAADPLGYTVWDTNGSLVWSRNGRGSCGLGYDPGVPGGNPAQGSGVAHLAFGSGRRALFAAATGNDIWTSANGMIILNATAGTFWRDIDFDDRTGDVYLRAGGNLLRWTRTGDNSVGVDSLLYSPIINANNVTGQNVAFLSSPFSSYVIYNRREASGPGQGFFSVVEVLRPDGTAPTVDWGTFAPPTGIALYDFAWHEPTETLAILDFANRNVNIFRVRDGIGMNYCPAVVNTTGAAGSLSARGSTVAAANNLTLTASQMPQNVFGFFLAGQNQGLIQNPGGSQGNLCLSGTIGRYVAPGQIMNAGANGSFALALNLTQTPAGSVFVSVTAGQTWNFQAWFRDIGPAGQPWSNFTDGLTLTFN